MHREIRSVPLVTASALAACSLYAASTVSAQSSELNSPGFEWLYNRVHQVLQGGTIFKPSESDPSKIALELYPLLLIESAPPLDSPAPRWGWGVVDHAKISPGPPTLYSAKDAVEIRGRLHTQYRHFWFYRSLAAPAASWKRQGLRITFAQDGSPAIWEVLDDSSGASAIYVTENLEKLAQNEFGPPSKGRRFWIENSTELFPETIVARTLGDGPIPMGPWVYLKGDSMDVTTLLCRCTPSQVKGDVTTAYYHPRSIPEESRSPDAIEADSSLNRPFLPWTWPVPSTWIEEALRLPSDF